MPGENNRGAMAGRDHENGPDGRDARVCVHEHFRCGCVNANGCGNDCDSWSQLWKSLE